MSPTQKTVLFLVGPTASGKGDAAFRMARGIGAEIVSLDSMKIYRGMDAGTAKPGADRRAKARYHLIDVLHPWEHCDLRRYSDMAEEAIADILGRGLVPLVSGGAGMYLRGLLYGVFRGPAADPEIRKRLKSLAAEKGVPHLHGMLAAIDPASAARIHPNDLMRIVRAIEVAEITGKPLSSHQSQKTQRTDFEARIAGIRRETGDLRRRIDLRADAMIARGFAEEVGRLWSSEKPPGRSASAALGYATMARHVAGEIGIEEAAAEIKKETWRFSRKQMTWFRSFPQIRWVDASEGEDGEVIAARVLDKLSNTAP